MFSYLLATQFNNATVKNIAQTTILFLIMLFAQGKKEEAAKV
jgi:hypothetical protein